MAYCIQTVILIHQPSIPYCVIKPWCQGGKGEKNKHYSKAETGECYRDALKEDIALMNKKLIYYISVLILLEGSCFCSKKKSVNSVFQKQSWKANTGVSIN